MRHDVNVFIFVLGVKSCNDIFYLVLAHFEIKCFLFQIPIIKNECQVISDSNFVVLGVSIFKNVPHDSDKHIEEMNDHHKATQIKGDVQVSLLGIVDSTKLELFNVVEV